jgi:hypothetical protein
MKLVFWSLAALNLLDYWLTSLILKSGGYEMNPLQNWFIEQFGTIGILYLKVPLLLILGYAVYFRWHELSEGVCKFAELLMYTSVGLYCIVVTWSVGIYLYATA